MFAAVFELFANEAYSIEVDTQSVLFVLGLILPAAGALLAQRLVVKGKG